MAGLGVPSLLPALPREVMAVQEAGSPMAAATVLRVAQLLAWTREDAEPAAPSAAPNRSPRAVSAREKRLRRRSARKRREELLRTARIEVLAVAHPGVTVWFGEHRLILEEAARSVRFRFDRDTQKVCMESLSGCASSPDDP